MQENCLKNFFRRAVCLGGAAALVSATAIVAPVGEAQAENASGGESVDGYVSCASYRAAEPTPEILGLDNVASNNATEAIDWSKPYFALFGSSYNSNPDPYLVNTLAKKGTGIVNDDTRSGGPTASLGDYTTSKVVWDQLPDVILGNSSNYDYNGDDYSVAAATANGKDSYKTYGTKGGGEGVIYDSTNIYTMIDSMYNLSSAAKYAANATGKKLRYGDADSATEITASFEEYVKGAQGYVLEQLAKEGKSKKKVALIYSYDQESNTYQIVPTGVAEGTATANRYLEAVQSVATNIADDGRDTTKVGTGRGAQTVATATPEEIADCDLILIGVAGNQTNPDTILGSLSTAEQKKTYWTSAMANGACYGVTVNSVENAQNTGRILPCLYPEYLDQSDMVAYYFQNFYHLSTGTLDEAVANAMSGVRNWNVSNGNSSEAVVWNKSDVAGYSASNVESKLDEGMRYIRDNSSKLGASAKLLAATDQYKASKTAYTTVSKGSGTTTPTKPATPAKTVGLAKGKTAKVPAGTVKASSSTTVTYAKVSSTSKKSVSIPATVKVNGKTYKVTAVAANAFKNSKATSVTIGSNVKTVSSKAFNNAKKLTKVTLGKNTTKLAKGAFYKTPKLKTIVVKSKKLTKKGTVKNALKGSKIRAKKLTIKRSGVAKKYVKKSFTKKNLSSPARVVIK